MTAPLARPRCLVPKCGGISHADSTFREAIWARYFTAAPRLRTPSELRYSDSQAHLRPFRRGSVRSLGGESVLPVLLRRGVFPTCVGVRPFVADALAPADGAREAQGAAAGELGGGDPDGRDEALRPRLCCDRYDGAAEGGDVCDRRQAAQPARKRLVRLAKKLGVSLRQSYARVGKLALIKHQRYAHAHQFKRANRSLRKLKIYLGRVIRDVERRIVGNEDLREAFVRPLFLARRVLEQERRQRGRKVYSLHAPEVECIGKGKAHRPYEFGVKVSVATTVKHSAGGQFVTHAAALPGNPYDGHTLATVIPQMQALIGNILHRCITDAGDRGHNAPPDHKFKVYTSGQKRRVTPQIKREFKRRAAIEPVIGHLKEHHRMGRNYLAHASGDAINAVLAAAGYNFRRLLAWLRLLWLRILIALG